MQSLRFFWLGETADSLKKDDMKMGLSIAYRSPRTFLNYMWCYDMKKMEIVANVSLCDLDVWLQWLWAKWRYTIHCDRLDFTYSLYCFSLTWF